jgi:hypothetical protein
MRDRIESVSGEAGAGRLLPKAMPLPAALPAALPVNEPPGDHLTGERSGASHPRGSWAQSVLPFASSLALHAGVVVLGLLTAKAIQTATGPASVIETQAFAPTTEIEESAVANGLTFASLTDSDSMRRVEQDEVAEVTTAGINMVAGPSTLQPLDGGGDGSNAATDALIGTGPGGGFKGGPRGPGQGPGGPLAPFGTPNTTGGPPAMFRAPGAQTVAYVCDASGSMIRTFSSLKAELTKAVTGLKPVQAFNIIFFQDERARTMSDGLLMATPENKARAFNFLDDSAVSGSTNPIPGIEQAFKSKPQLVYLLTDADFPDNAAVLAAIRRLNPTGRTKVNTIAFVERDDELSQAFVETMKTIARENKGTFKLVKESDLR